MIKILFTIISFAVCLSISGQQISQSNNRYRGNDALEKKQVTVKSQGDRHAVMKKKSIRPCHREKCIKWIFYE